MKKKNNQINLEDNLIYRVSHKALKRAKKPVFQIKSVTKKRNFKICKKKSP